MLTLILSDLHVDSVIKTAGTALTDDCASSIVFITHCIQQINKSFKPMGKKIEACIIAGDIFNRPSVTDQELFLFKDLRSRLPEDTYVIQGNHDRGEMSIPSICYDCVDINEMTAVMKDGTKIYGIKAPITPEYMQDALQRVPKDTDILVTHLPVTPFSSFGHVLQMDCREFTQAPLTIAGDTHITAVQEFTDTDKLRHTVVSPGALYPRDKHELLSMTPGFCIADTDDLHTISKIPIAKRAALDMTNADVTETAIAEALRACKDSTLCNTLRPIAYVSEAAYEDLKDAVLLNLGVQLIPVPVKIQTVGSEVAVERETRSFRERFIDAAQQIIDENDLQPDILNILTGTVFSSDPKAYLQDLIKSKGF